MRHMELDEVIRFSETAIFVCREIKLTFSPALWKLYCSYFYYIVLFFVCVKFTVNYRKFLDICHSLFFLLCCLFSGYCRNLITTAQLAKISQKWDREGNGDLAKEFKSRMLHSEQNALPTAGSDTLVGFWTTALYASLGLLGLNMLAPLIKTLYSLIYLDVCLSALPTKVLKMF